MSTPRETNVKCPGRILYPETRIYYILCKSNRRTRRALDDQDDCRSSSWLLTIRPAPFCPCTLFMQGISRNTFANRWSWNPRDWISKNLIRLFVRRYVQD